MRVVHGEHHQKGSLSNPLSLDLSDVTWEAAGDVDEETDPRSHLTAVVDILGVKHHIEAIEVETEDGRDPVNPFLESSLDGVWQIAGLDTSKMRTVEIEGRTYVLVLTPFAS